MDDAALIQAIIRQPLHRTTKPARTAGYTHRTRITQSYERSTRGWRSWDWERRARIQMSMRHAGRMMTRRYAMQRERGENARALGNILLKSA